MKTYNKQYRYFYLEKVDFKDYSQKYIDKNRVLYYSSLRSIKPLGLKDPTYLSKSHDIRFMNSFLFVSREQINCVELNTYKRKDKFLKYHREKVTKF